MPEQSIIVWDLETVPDLAAAARMLDLGDHPRRTCAKRLEWVSQNIRCIKIRLYRRADRSRQAEGWRIDALGAPHVGERTEPELISAFVERVGQLRPQLITFNGHRFDLPVLRYRAMVNRISVAGLQVRPYFHRFSDDALDLCDALGSFSPGARVKLDQISKILSLTVSPRGLTAARWRRSSSLDRSKSRRLL